jgi:hypothetical protein
MVIELSKLTSKVTAIVARYIHFITTRQLDHFVRKNKQVFDELAKQ